MSNFAHVPLKGVSTEFMKIGNCAGTDPAQFFPERGDFHGLRNAKAVCAGCEVQEECLEYALTSPIEKHGVWGGKSEKERRPIRVARRARRTLTA